MLLGEGSAHGDDEDEDKDGQTDCNPEFFLQWEISTQVRVIPGQKNQSPHPIMVSEWDKFKVSDTQTQAQLPHFLWDRSLVIMLQHTRGLIFTPTCDTRLVF